MSALETLGKHEIRRQLGRGAMGTVYEGWDPVIKRQVAIKTVRLPDATDDEAVDEIARFRREAQAAGRLNHPNIIGVFDYGETADLAYIVMEFVDGPTLKSLLDKHERFPLPRIARIMEDLLAGLQYSHERGVVHRDIKPANLMLTSSGQAKIADFGIARIESSSMTLAGTVIGTPAYMSPEQFMGMVVDARSDIYSSGVLLYQLLTGERPFEGSMSSIMHKALHTEPPSPSQISVTTPRQFDAVVKRAMAKRPEDRFPSVKEFAIAIREAAAVAAQPRAEPDDAGGEATIVETPRSFPRAIGSTRPSDVVRAVAAATGPAAGGASARPGKSIASPAVLGAGAAGLAVLGGVAWFLLSGTSEPGPPRQPTPGTAGPVTTAPPAFPGPPVPQPASVGSGAPVTPPPSTPPAAVPPPPTVALAPSSIPPGPDSAPQVPPPGATSPPPDATPPANPSPTPALSPSPANPLPPATQSPTPVSPPSPDPSPTPALSPVLPPSPPAMPTPLERARQIARSVPCSALHVTTEPDGLRISGIAAEGQELDGLLAEARDAGHLTDEVTRAGRFVCAPLSTISALARETWDSVPRNFAVTLDQPNPVSGGRLGIDVATSLPVVYVDLYQGDGTVRHLLRPGSSTSETNPRAASVVVPVPGPGLIVAIGSTAWLESGARPERDKAADYLTVLQARLQNAAPPPEVDVAMVTVRPPEPKVRPVEPAVTKTHPPEPVRPAEPSVVRVPPSHPPALRSARCSNIVSRAQLGETLSDAELLALRTECRS